jgi:endonuclease/exonuclease/phosphatase family metal-dependent hydrolase
LKLIVIEFLIRYNIAMTLKFWKLRWYHWLWFGPLVVILLTAGLFTLNGLVLANAERPIGGTLKYSPAEPIKVPAEGEPAPQIKILAFNLAKCFFSNDNRTFVPAEQVRERIKRIAAIIKREQPDLVFLSESVKEAGWTGVDHVGEIAELTEMHAWAFGENMNFGLPFYRVVSGNTILSRRPLELVANPSLYGRKPFYVTANNRRILYCQQEIAGKKVLLGSVHNDSWVKDVNYEQLKQELDYIGDRPTILAGDFNAFPEWEQLKLIKQADRFTGMFEGPPTFTGQDISYKKQIDYIFVPKSWELVEHHVVQDDVSDHNAIVSTFRVIWR